jgi:hypothetical protein
MVGCSVNAVEYDLTSLRETFGEVCFLACLCFYIALEVEAEPNAMLSRSAGDFELSRGVDASTNAAREMSAVVQDIVMLFTLSNNPDG